MRLPAGPRFSRSPHLVELIAEAERLAAAVGEALDGDAGAVDDLVTGAAVATLQLDGSPITEPPSELPDDLVGSADVGNGALDPRPSERRQGTWLDAMARDLEHASDERIMVFEYLGARAGLGSDDLAEHLLVGAGDALPELHRRMTRGLLSADHAGRPRVTEQAVHDASAGRIIYFPAEPADIPGRINVLDGWLGSAGAREHAVIVSGVLHFELLHIHPFEAANGRLARTAARLVLRARGLDPCGAAAAETVLRTDAMGYYEEVARTLRRRDLTIWLERWGEAVAGGLRVAARRLGALGDDVTDRAAGFLQGWTAPGFTIADYRAGAGVGPEDARGDLARLLDAGRIERVPGSRGLRFTVTDAR